MTDETRPVNEITQDAIRILCKEIGVANTIRFINHFTTGYGDYTKERKRMFADMTLDDILSEIRRIRNE